MHALNTGKHLEWLANTQSCQSSRGCGSGRWRAAGLLEHPQGSVPSSASRSKEGKSEWTFSAGSLLWCLHHSLPSPAQTGLRFSFSPSVGALWGHPDGTRSPLQWESPGQMRWPLDNHCSVPLIWPNIAHQSFWKTAVSHLNLDSCEKSSFLQERMMMLRVCLNVFFSCELKHWAKSSAHVCLNTTFIELKEKIPIDSYNLTDPNTKAP